MSDDSLLAKPDAEPFANQPDPQDQRTRDVGSLVGDWLSWSEAAEAMGLSVSKVRQLIKEGQLAALVPEPGAGQKIPAAFLDGREIVKGVPGLLTVLHDAGFTDHEIIEWVFTADPTLPGRPIDALRENRGSEVKRRAQSMGF
ncbi:Rv2175c family DNA-binding protein [Nocardioides marmoribigeumensis]|jgi:excisionase family DNA binding protein|uniref:Excisionase family DNA binding protein n=1 Tax=Nocardioides marmoribigeumensis TaxID=433649 RepID=A0ABU2BRQ6_9ACTN|nr:Rv2175c family DNA-binding protein [Nocardioides marmoribigeumensis]MDR7361306.1 excisionase family DNA binding protein [Nocardioides marmoribigeumensis]